MRTVSHYGVHKERGISWLLQDSKLSESAVGLPPSELFEAELLVHPKVLRRCPHAYDLSLETPRGGELARLLNYVTLEPVLRYLLPSVHPVGTNVLLRIHYEVADPVMQALRLIEGFHAKVDPITFPIGYFDLQHRSLSTEAARTNVMPLVITGFSRARMNKLPQLAAELALSPRRTIVVSPLAVIAMGSFIPMESRIMHTNQFINFLETADLPRLGVEWLRSQMKGVQL